MRREVRGTLPLYFFERFLHYNDIVHFVSTRQGGVSEGAYESLNIGFNTGDGAENVLKNREIIANRLSIPLEHFVSAKQVHGDRISLISTKDQGKGAKDYETAISDTDTLITKESGICLIMRVADCVPILLFDPKKHSIGIVHAGWRGSVKFIALKAVGQMYGHFASRPEDMIATIGPSIGPCCYEVGSEVIQALKGVVDVKMPTGLIRAAKGRMHLNLWELNKQQLLRAGLQEKNIEVAGICTKDNHDIFFSARADGEHTGRFAAGIMLQ